MKMTINEFVEKMTPTSRYCERRYISALNVPTFLRFPSHFLLLKKLSMT